MNPSCVRHIVLVTFAAWTLAGCASHPRPATPDALGAATAEAVAAAVREAATDWVAAFARHDVDAITAGFAEDAVALYPRSAPTIGREANRSAWARFYTRPNAEHPLAVDAMVLSRGGDMAATRGRWAARYDAPDGAVDVGGDYLAVWRPDAAGVWRIETLAANMYSPPPGLEPLP